MMTNYIIYNRNNKTLELSNHTDKDRELDAQYTLLRNVALTGRFIDGEFYSRSNKHFRWLMECARTKSNGQYCPRCKSIFRDPLNSDYRITEFYREKVVKIDNDIDIEHPLTDYILKKFTKRGEYDDRIDI